ncbi:putative trans-sulfuration enzyme [Rhodotorula toruloides]|uniref:BY PROTMAP: gi/647403126/emb/CDR49284.1/ RHTO0S25e00430g1_1 [Rhodosporidium toruloides] n=1 Tax=Rhodotorula toruloides TaxID=5286 RepID=A0A0K3CPU4_RHOTO|nr:putative trans-sulfuration enzyme [Rhodotorula toruloides]
MAPDAKAGLATRSIHYDSDLSGPEVAANISTTTTFRHPSPKQIASKPEGYYSDKWDASEPSRDIYSRYTQPTLTRVERVLSSIIGQPTVVYPSGISSAFAVLLLVRPDVIAITEGYHGCHASLEVYRRLRGEDQVSVIKLDDEYPNGKKLLCWVETPLNPTGESRSIAAYAKRARAVGGTVGVDATFAPPPLQDPFKWGADVVMHSGTKYFAGHSDTLCGTVSVRNKEDWLKLWHDRTYTGSNIGSLDTWLLLRSLRTLSVRVNRQSATATALAQWLASLTRAESGSDLDGPGGVVEKVWHTSLQEDRAELLGEGKQMEKGPATFGMLLKKPEYATNLPHSLKFFVPATSLGGVESLIEQRSLSDPNADPRLIRLSIGLEDFEDLKRDLVQGFRNVIQIEQGKVSKL